MLNNPLAKSSEISALGQYLEPVRCIHCGQMTYWYEDVATFPLPFCNTICQTAFWTEAVWFSADAELDDLELNVEMAL